MSQPADPMLYFRLKPIKAARVSEISEATAMSPVPAEERINFHIGNPLQDARLSSAFLRIALGIDVHLEELTDLEPEPILDHLGWEKSDRPLLDFLIRTIRKSSPYLPRGGYSRLAPHALIQKFYHWLEHQQEPLHYDSGEKSGRRELILVSGGVQEALRVLLFALSAYLKTVPARILCYRCEILAQLKEIPNLVFEDLPGDENLACEQIEGCFTDQPQKPTFVIIGSLLGEITRRKLRLLSVNTPLFFIEANDAPNHLSLAREAKLVHRVIRLLTPAIFADELRTLSTVFVAGNADFLSVVENVHFGLKGTPSASEVELLTFLLDNWGMFFPKKAPPALSNATPTFDGSSLGMASQSALEQLTGRVVQHIDHFFHTHTQTLEKTLAILEEKTGQIASKAHLPSWNLLFDEFAGVDAKDLLDRLLHDFYRPAFSQSLQRSFLSVFLKHQPQYKPEACRVASGSSRTALGILGFHCGITEVVIPDLSWSYEQCFPKVHPVALAETFELDVDAIIAKLEQLCQRDPSWVEYGAVAINNPHNATGRIFDEQEVRRLVAYCLQHSILVVDDLAYQNVAPVDDFPEIKTARQVASDLARLGIITEKQAERVITVHSMSKTDCLAGARLAVVEIRDQEIRQRFDEVNRSIQPNLAAIFIGYLFYRSATQCPRAYWRLRNKIFAERTQALLTAMENLPPERNPYQLRIIPPAGSMYPLLQVGRLPYGLSLDTLASSLARSGVGMLPLGTFARTEKGFDTGRTTFRLTLGGVDGAEVLLPKTRRLLIDMNRLIAEEDARYNRKSLKLLRVDRNFERSSELLSAWESVSKQILLSGADGKNPARQDFLPLPNGDRLKQEFWKDYAPERLKVFQTRLMDRALIIDELVRRSLDDGGKQLAERLSQEFMKDSLSRRQDMFKSRSYDRTVHPTQMYSLRSEMALETIIQTLIARQAVKPLQVEKAAQELWREYLGLNVAISSQQEAEEVLLDLSALAAGEDYTRLFSQNQLHAFLSFWSDWDGSNRPSGQGHVLVAGMVMENVRRMARIISLLRLADPHLQIQPDLISELEGLPQRNQRFWQLLQSITQLTHQLERRYRSVLPYAMETTPLQRFAIRWHLRRDPVKVMLQHNDRYEQKMLELRQQRRKNLEEYFSLNKRLRKQLFALIPVIQDNLSSEILLREVVGYQDILQRAVITPRIPQAFITARDQFAIDTTVYNIEEINSIAGKYGNPGMILALQISLSTKADTLIALDRKMRNQGGQIAREYPGAELPSIWLIPLFEDAEAVSNIRSYLDQIWDYAIQSRHINQSPQSRFSEILSEVFIAGSDLSQQVSQAAAAYLYRKSKYELQTWLAEHGVAEAVRIKLGSGEPMQRQGGYYSAVAGLHAFVSSQDSHRRFQKRLSAPARQSTSYAVTPLQGVYLGGDLRTFQSNLSEKLRQIPVQDFASLLHHVRASQKTHQNDLIRAAESIMESRLGAQSRSVKELERLTIGLNETDYEQFLSELTDNFRHILYGRQEDVVGIHIISYFIARSIPQLRDRPTSRSTLATGAERGRRILANIAEIIPLSNKGSLLRAISHNQAQTAVLGVNQLTTGLFRAIERFAQKAFPDAEQERMIAERILPHLPVYEILNSLRLYQDRQGKIIAGVETAFPAGNTAFVALREDSDAMQRYVYLFQQELLRRHGLNVSEFFTNGVFLPDLLPTLRPDLAVLLQKDLFNTDLEAMLEQVTGNVNGLWRTETARLLELPQKIASWRSVIWEVMGDSIYQRVQSFTELAAALYAFSSARSFTPPSPVLRETRLPPALASFFRAARADDEMRNFLYGAIEYLGSFTDSNMEIPVSIIRAMNDVERLAQIEESAFDAEKQNLIRCCVLQIARLAGENG